jgi:pimeloyl-ACP methyl ester carboxylesterase
VADPVVLVHGSANGAGSWRPVATALERAGKRVFSPDLLGYGSAPKASDSYGIAEEVAHLVREIDDQGIGTLHLAAHSLGCMMGLHARRVLGPRVRTLTLIDPVIVSVLRVPGEEAAFAEMEAQYQRFMAALPDPVAAARTFVEHWSGAGTWDALGEKARTIIASVAPKLRVEMLAARTDRTPLPALAESPPATTVVVGEETLVAPRAVARLLANALGGRTVVVPGARHMIPITHPAGVVAAILEGDRS